MGRNEEEKRGTFWRGTAIDMESRLRIGREEVKATSGIHRAYVERTNLTSRQMNGRLVRKTLSFSKELRFLEAASGWEDAMYNFTRPLKTVRLKQEEQRGSTRWRQRTPAMAAGLTAHVWAVQELLNSVLVPSFITT